MGLFSRKRKSVLDRERLAEAIVYTKFDLEKLKNKPLFDREELYSIKLGEYLCLSGSCRFFKSSQTDYPSSYSLVLHTHVDGIHMADYQFRIYVDIPSWRDFNEDWECKKLTIIHKMPEQFIELMNEWSSSVLLEKSEKTQTELEQQRQKHLEAQLKFEEEEQHLSLFR